jgi:hypothetical protein
MSTHENSPIRAESSKVETPGIYPIELSINPLTGEDLALPTVENMLYLLSQDIGIPQIRTLYNTSKHAPHRTLETVFHEYAITEDERTDPHRFEILTFRYIQAAKDRQPDQFEDAFGPFLSGKRIFIDTHIEMMNLYSQFGRSYEAMAKAIGTQSKLASTRVQPLQERLQRELTETFKTTILRRLKIGENYVDIDESKNIYYAYAQYLATQDLYNPEYKENENISLTRQAVEMHIQGKSLLSVSAALNTDLRVLYRIISQVTTLPISTAQDFDSYCVEYLKSMNSAEMLKVLPRLPTEDYTAHIKRSARTQIPDLEHRIVSLMQQGVMDNNRILTHINEELSIEKPTNTPVVTQNLYNQTIASLKQRIRTLTGRNDTISDFEIVAWSLRKYKEFEQRIETYPELHSFINVCPTIELQNFVGQTLPDNFQNIPIPLNQSEQTWVTYIVAGMTNAELKRFDVDTTDDWTEDNLLSKFAQEFNIQKRIPANIKKCIVAWYYHSIYSPLYSSLLEHHRAEKKDVKGLVKEYGIFGYQDEFRSLFEVIDQLELINFDTNIVDIQKIESLQNSGIIGTYTFQRYDFRQLCVVNDVKSLSDLIHTYLKNMQAYEAYADK